MEEALHSATHAEPCPLLATPEKLFGSHCLPGTRASQSHRGGVRCLQASSWGLPPIVRVCHLTSKGQSRSRQCQTSPTLAVRQLAQERVLSPPPTPPPPREEGSGRRGLSSQTDLYSGCTVHSGLLSPKCSRCPPKCSSLSPVSSSLQPCLPSECLILSVTRAEPGGGLVHSDCNEN